MNDVERAAWRAKTYLKSTRSPLGDLTQEAFEEILAAFVRVDHPTFSDDNDILTGAIRSLR